MITWNHGQLRVLLRVVGLLTACCVLDAALLISPSRAKQPHSLTVITIIIIFKVIVLVILRIQMAPGGSLLSCGIALGLLLIVGLCG